MAPSEKTKDTLLIAAYQQAALNIQSTLQGTNATNRNRSLATINSYLRALDKQTSQWIKDEVPQHFTGGSKEAIDFMREFQAQNTGPSVEPAQNKAIVETAEALGTSPQELVRVVSSAGGNLSRIKGALREEFGTAFDDLEASARKAVLEGGSLGLADIADPLRKAVFGDLVNADDTELQMVSMGLSRAQAKLIAEAAQDADFLQVVDKWGNDVIGARLGFDIPETSLDDFLKAKPSKIGNLKLDWDSVKMAADDIKDGVVYGESGQPITGKIAEPVNVFYDTETGEYTLQNGYHRLLHTIKQGDTRLPGDVVFGARKKGDGFYIDTKTKLVGPKEGTPRGRIVNAAGKDAIRAGDIDETFSLIHTEALQQLVDDATARFGSSLEAVRGSAKGVISDIVKRKIMQEAAVNAITGGADDTAKAKAILAADGVTSFRTKNGQNLKLEVYAATLMRTVISEAHNTGASLRYMQNGVKYGRCIERANAPDRPCRFFRNKYVNLAERRLYAPFHPNCMGGIAPVLKLPEGVVPFESIDDPRIPGDVQAAIAKRV